jgi:hypothetical protein
LSAAFFLFVFAGFFIRLLGGFSAFAPRAGALIASAVTPPLFVFGGSGRQTLFTPTWPRGHLRSQLLTDLPLDILRTCTLLFGQVESDLLLASSVEDRVPSTFLLPLPEETLGSLLKLGLLRLLLNVVFASSAVFTDATLTPFLLQHWSTVDFTFRRH